MEPMGACATVPFDSGGKSGLVALPKILEPGELVQSLSLGDGNTGRAHDLETDRRIDEFPAGRDGAALSQRARR
jgi:hypothetical protein